MTKKDAQLKQRALTWKKATPALRAARRADIRKQDNMLVIAALDSLFRQSIAKSAPRKSSGLVQMYEVLKRHYMG